MRHQGPPLMRTSRGSFDTAVWRRRCRGTSAQVAAGTVGKLGLRPRDVVRLWQKALPYGRGSESEPRASASGTGKACNLAVMALVSQPGSTQCNTSNGPAPDYNPNVDEPHRSESMSCC